MTTAIDNNTKAEILKGIIEANKIISKELNFSKDLRNERKIEIYRNYINEMKLSLSQGFLNL